LLKRKGCRDANLGQSDDAMEGIGVGEGVDFFAAAEAEDGSAEEEEGDVGAYFGGHFEAGWTGERYA
jgi:hypothetical protein